MKVNLVCFCIAFLLWQPLIILADDIPPPKWRVVNTKHPTLDVVIAGYTVQDFGAKGDGICDDTAAFQAAMNALSYAGGGAVFVPEAKYAIRGNLVIPTGVTLRGEWAAPVPGHSVRGTILMAYADRGSAEGEAFITVEQSAGVMDLAVWYPEQDTNHIVPYPFCFRHPSRNCATIENVTMVNPYQGIITGPEAGNQMHLFKHVYGTPLAAGLDVNAVYDCGRLEHIHFSPSIWSDSELPGAPAKNGPHAQFMLANGVGMRLRRTDYEYGAFCHVEGYNNGIVLTPSKEGEPSGGFYGMTVSNCRNALTITELNHGIGTSFTECTFDGIDTGIISEESLDAGVVFHSCTFRGGKRSADLKGRDDSRLIFQRCSFNGEVSRASGNLSLVGCSFTATGTHIRLEENANAVVIAGCSFNGAPLIESRIASGKVTVNHDAIPAAPLPQVVLTDKVRKPPKTDLYVVTDAAWGAKKDATTDDTGAIQKAIDAAARNGGGVVFLPGGEYTVKGNLTVRPNVELRGVYDVPHHTAGKGSTLRLFAGRNDENAAPAIVMENNSILRGLTFVYPEQVETDIVPYPYTVQGRGEKIAVINVAAMNSYKCLDFMTYRCDGHFIDYPGMGALKVGIAVGGGSVGGEVRNAHVNPHFWTASKYKGNIPRIPPREQGGIFAAIPVAYANTHLTAYLFGDCKDELHFHCMVCPTLYGFRFVAQNGRGGSALLVGGDSDVSCIPAVFDAGGDGGIDFINAAFSCIRHSGMKYLTMSDEFKTTVRMFNATLWGESAASAVVKGGTLAIDGANFISYENILVAGGELSLVNNYLGASRSGEKEITLADGGKAKLIGCITPFGMRRNAEAPPDDFIDRAGSQMFFLPEGAREISTDLGKRQMKKGVMLREKGPECANAPTVRGGRPAWQSTKPIGNDLYYMTFIVQYPEFKGGKTPNVTISGDYFDEGKGTCRIVYDSSDEKVQTKGYGAGAWKEAGRFAFTNTNTWKTFSVAVTDALFTGRCNGGDVRLNITNRQAQPAIARFTISRSN